MSWLSNQYMKPSFLIIGGVKCGTSSLYRYLNAHPQVLPCKTKEPQFFSTKNPLKIYLRLQRYFALFPKKDFHGAIQADWLDLVDGKALVASKIQKVKEKHQQYISGEASANTFFAANPKIVKRVLPNARLIMLTRQPSERFYSHYQMFTRFTKEGKKGFELAPLMEFIDQEIDGYKSGKTCKLIHQGLYMNYLPQWEKTFGKDRLVVIPTTQLNQSDTAEKTLQALCHFLEIDSYEFGEVLTVKHNQAVPAKLPKAAKEKLDAFYQASMDALAQRYGIHF